MNARVSGRIICNIPDSQIDAARRGLGLAWMMQDFAIPLIESGDVVAVPDAWSGTFPGFHRYYPNRRPQSPAFAPVITALRWRG